MDRQLVASLELYLAVLMDLLLGVQRVVPMDLLFLDLMVAQMVD